MAKYLQKTLGDWGLTFVLQVEPGFEVQEKGNYRSGVNGMISHVNKW